MPVLDVLAQLEPKVLVVDADAVERRDLGPVLDPVQLGGEDELGLRRRVGDEEAEVDQVVGVRELREQLEVGREVGLGVL